jgi:hypothetical protein
MTQGSMVSLSRKINVIVRDRGDNSFNITWDTPLGVTVFEGLSFADMKALSKKFAEAVDCHSREVVAEDAAIPEAPRHTGMLRVRVRYYDSLDRTVELETDSRQDGHPIAQNKANRRALAHEGGFQDWLLSERGDGTPTQSEAHIEAGYVIDHINASLPFCDSGRLGDGGKYIAWRR